LLKKFFLILKSCKIYLDYNSKKLKKLVRLVAWVGQHMVRRKELFMIHGLD